MTLTARADRPSDHTLLVLLIEALAERDLISTLPGHVYDWVDSFQADHHRELDSRLDSRPLVDPVERQDP